MGVSFFERLGMALRRVCASSQRGTCSSTVACNGDDLQGECLDGSAVGVQVNASQKEKTGEAGSFAGFDLLFVVAIATAMEGGAAYS
jgi:hypothetical protein